MYAHVPVTQLHVCVNMPQEVGMRHTVWLMLKSLSPSICAVNRSDPNDGLSHPPSLNVNSMFPQACDYISFTCSWEWVQFLLYNIIKFLILHWRKNFKDKGETRFPLSVINCLPRNTQIRSNLCPTVKFAPKACYLFHWWKEARPPRTWRMRSWRPVDIAIYDQ